MSPRTDNLHVHHRDAAHRSHLHTVAAGEPPAT
jgi:hypothetical protein